MARGRCAVLFVALGVGCGANDAGVQHEVVRLAPPTGTVVSTSGCPELPAHPEDDVWFEEVSATAGIGMSHTLADWTGLPERMQGGVCLLDADGDGRLDLFFAAFDGQGGSKLYLATDAPLRYRDASIERGLSKTGKSTGCLAFDVDGDGDRDLLTTGVGGARLWRNDAGRFVEASERLPPPRDPLNISMMAVAFDADGDGDLDLAIAEYGHYQKPPPGPKCDLERCDLSPENYRNGTTVLWLQKDDGTFEDATARLGPIANEPALVLLATDLDEDGKIDLFVGNDLSIYEDHYFRSVGPATFVDVAKPLGVAVSARPSGISSMSTSDVDHDGDGHLDLLESSWDNEPNALFKCPGRIGTVESPACVDVAESLELFRTPMNLRWGQALADFDDDGIPEIIEAAGHFYVAAEGGPTDTFPPASVPPNFWHRTKTSSPYVLMPSLGALSEKTAGRGLVAGDLDGDGDLDVVIGTALGHPLLLRNVRKNRGHALEVRLRGKGKNREAIGARVLVTTCARKSAQMVHAGSSYLSSDDGRIHVGLGAEERARSVDVTWPSGAKTHLDDVKADVPFTIDEP